MLHQGRHGLLGTHPLQGSRRLTADIAVAILEQSARGLNRVGMGKAAENSKDLESHVPVCVVNVAGQ